MSRGGEAFGVALLLLACLALIASPDASVAQDPDGRVGTGTAGENRFRLDARAGIALPAGDLKDYVDEGLVLGAGAAYRIRERWSVRADWTAALMRRAKRRPLQKRGIDIPTRGSKTDLHHVTAAAEVELSDPERADIEVRAHGGLGVTFLSTEETELAVGGHFTPFTVVVGLELGVPVSDDVRLIGRADVYALPTKSETPVHLDKEVTLPFTVGVAAGL